MTSFRMPSKSPCIAIHDPDGTLYLLPDADDWTDPLDDVLDLCRTAVSDYAGKDMPEALFGYLAEWADMFGIPLTARIAPIESPPYYPVIVLNTFRRKVHVAFPITTPEIPFVTFAAGASPIEAASTVRRS